MEITLGGRMTESIFSFHFLELDSTLDDKSLKLKNLNMKQ